MGFSSLTRDWTQAPCIGSMESQPLDHQWSPLRWRLLVLGKLYQKKFLSPWGREGHLPGQTALDISNRRVWDVPGGSSGKETVCQCRRHRRYRWLGFDPWVEKTPWRRAWQPTPVSMPGESHGQRSLVGYSPWGLKESEMKRLSMCARNKSVLGSSGCYNKRPPPNPTC